MKKMANEKRLIDLDATLKRLEKESWWLESVKDCIRLFLAKAKLVDAVEVVHGRWMNVQNGKGICSNCNRLDSIDNLATHCRYCGAKMGVDGSIEPPKKPVFEEDLADGALE